MKDLKSVFDSGELTVLYRVFAMLKYGFDDDHRMLQVISSPIFKELNDAIYNETISMNNECVLVERDKVPLNEYIENKEFQFKALKDHVRRCIKMYSGSEEYNWSEWQEDWKRGLVINLASPYRIHDETIDEMLKLHEH